MPPVERPILMNPASMQGLMDHRKTQTRRLLLPQPPDGFELNPDYQDVGPFKLLGGKFTGWGFCDSSGREYRCPYGQPGDRLWVRETWRPLCRCGLQDALIQYQAGGTVRQVPDFPGAHKLGPWWKHCLDPWRPSIFMPRAASRALLEVVNVRLEPLQAISFEDALAEGIISTPFWSGPPSPTSEELYLTAQTRPIGFPLLHTDGPINQGWVDYARLAYAKLWDSINAGRGHPWASNPWVWAVSFQVLEFRGRPEPACYLEDVGFDQPSEARQG